MPEGAPGVSEPSQEAPHGDRAASPLSQPAQPAPSSQPAANRPAWAPSQYDDGTRLPQEPPNPGNRRRRWWWLLPILVVAALVFVIARRAPKQDAQQAGGRGATGRGNRAVPIVTATVKKGSIDVYLQALGAVTPVSTVTVTSRVQGQIIAVDFKEGQMVHKGSPLLTVDPRPYQAALTQAQGQLDHDQAVLEEARIDLERYKAAIARNAIPKQQLDDQEKVVQQDEGTVKNDTGAVDNAKVNLQYCYITSPIDGRVGLRLVDVGNIVQANSNSGLMVITQLQPITVVMSIAEDYLPQIQEQLRQGKQLSVDAFDRTQQKLLAHGTLLTLDNVIDPTTGTLKLKAIFPNSDGSLFPNQFVNARLLLSTLENVNLVPSAAIQRNGQGPFVYVVGADQTAQSRPVTVTASDNANTAIGGVDAGTVVAVNGFDKMIDGIKVTTSFGGGAGAGGAGGGRHGRGGHGGQGGATGASGATGAGGQSGQSGDSAQPGQTGGGQHRHGHRPPNGTGGSNGQGGGTGGNGGGGGNAGNGGNGGGAGR